MTILLRSLAFLPVFLAESLTAFAPGHVFKDVSIAVCEIDIVCLSRERAGFVNA